MIFLKILIPLLVFIYNNARNPEFSNIEKKLLIIENLLEKNLNLKEILSI